MIFSSEPTTTSEAAGRKFAASTSLPATTYIFDQCFQLIFQWLYTVKGQPYLILNVKDLGFFSLCEFCFLNKYLV